MKKIIIALILCSAFLLHATLFSKPDQHVTNYGINMIANFEGNHLKSYLDCRGVNPVWTVGIGNTSHAAPGMIITRKQSFEFFRTDISRFENYINKRIDRLLFWYEFDALTSWTFNCGKILHSDYKSAIEENNTNYITYKMSLWINAGGKRLRGLERRRNAEINLYRGNYGK